MYGSSVFHFINLLRLVEGIFLEERKKERPFLPIYYEIQ